MIKYVVRKAANPMQYLVQGRTWTTRAQDATLFPLQDLAPIERLSGSPMRASIGIVFDLNNICWLPISKGNWYTIDESAPLTVLELLPLVEHYVKIYRLEEGNHGVLVDGEPYPKGSGFYLKTSEKDATIAAERLGGEVFECLTHY